MIDAVIRAARFCYDHGGFDPSLSRSATEGDGMSWRLTYVLPWPALDIPAIEAAIEQVLAQLPPRPRESQLDVRGPDFANWFVTVYPDEERRWALGSRAAVDKQFGLYGIAEDEPLWVDIVFSHDPGDSSLGSVPRTTFWFDTAWSGNSLAPGCAAHVCQLLGTHFGVECERD